MRESRMGFGGEKNFVIVYAVFFVAGDKNRSLTSFLCEEEERRKSRFETRTCYLLYGPYRGILKGNSLKLTLRYHRAGKADIRKYPRE